MTRSRPREMPRPVPPRHRRASGIWPVPSGLQLFSLGLRVLMEAGIVAAFGYWGYHTGTTTVEKVLLAVGAPALGFGLWGAVDFHWAGRLSEALRLIEELLISGGAAVALYAAGRQILGWALALVSVVYHALLYAQGGRLLKGSQTRTHAQ